MPTTLETFEAMRKATKVDEIIPAYTQALCERDDKPYPDTYPTISELSKINSKQWETDLFERLIAIREMLNRKICADTELYNHFVPPYADEETRALQTQCLNAREINRERIKAEESIILCDTLLDNFTETIEINQALRLPGQDPSTLEHIIKGYEKIFTVLLEWLQLLWKRAYIINSDILTPVAPIIKAWCNTDKTKVIDQDYDDTHPYGMTPRATAILTVPLGSIKEVDFSGSGEARLAEFATPESIKQVDDVQTYFNFAQEEESKLPPFMFLKVAERPSTRCGTVPHELRIFDEAIMALNPTEKTEKIKIKLGTLIKFLYPNNKFHRTNQLKYIIWALEYLHTDGTVPFRQPESGNINEWRAVTVINPLNTNSKDNDWIYLNVILPDDATRRMLVEKHALRILGQKSAPRQYAYKAAHSVWDHYCTVDGKLIYPTRPIIKVNANGYLIDTKEKAKEKVLVDSHGKPIRKQDAYTPDALAQLEREPAPGMEKYPILSNSDLIKACYPFGHMKNRTEALRRAQNYWTQLAKEGYVVIDDTVKGGWRIMPPESHFKGYRAVKEATKQSRKNL